MTATALHHDGIFKSRPSMRIAHSLAEFGSQHTIGLPAWMIMSIVSAYGPIGLYRRAIGALNA